MVNLKLSKEIYEKDKILTAQLDYENYANITVLEENDSWILGFDKCKYGEERTVKEFENYLIELENR